MGSANGGHSHTCTCSRSSGRRRPRPCAPKEHPQAQRHPRRASRRASRRAVQLCNASGFRPLRDSSAERMDCVPSCCCRREMGSLGLRCRSQYRTRRMVQTLARPSHTTQSQAVYHLQGNRPSIRNRVHPPLRARLRFPLTAYQESTLPQLVLIRKN